MSSSKESSGATCTLVCIQDYEDRAKDVLPAGAFNYYIDHADEGQTMKDCKTAFKRYRLRPRLLRDVSNRQFSTTVLGHPVSFPICISPTASQGFADIEGDKATARAAESLNTIMIDSHCAFFTFEDISLAAPNAMLWFQIHLYKDRKVTRYFIKKAERAGFKAVVVTIDSPVLGNRRSMKRGKYLTPREEYRLINFYNPNNPEVISAIDNGDIALWDYTQEQLITAETWEGIKWLRSITKLPIVVKGILTSESAREAVQAGVDAILVSAHGGRQLDGVLATIDALPEVVEAIKGSGVEIYMDGGVRQGTDVFKALALGARAVFLGRPILWGLANGGENGVKKVLEIVRDEFSLTMALTGCSKLNDVKASMVVHESEYLSKL
ncbi:LOW QUALITY PROTEIN: 2-Hydroxyacid oxidase 1-like [Amphiura filiformis]|uniref:LOW QUALITY PROTEIN: 2-Hydroxyacid oxidase 1-like n=1 Tax=Amphiura filiformis TaxID=82378 RepID=UPI003B2247D7